MWTPVEYASHSTGRESGKGEALRAGCGPGGRLYGTRDYGTTGGEGGAVGDNSAPRGRDMSRGGKRCFATAVQRKESETRSEFRYALVFWR